MDGFSEPDLKRLQVIRLSGSSVGPLNAGLARGVILKGVLYLSSSTLPLLLVHGIFELGLALPTMKCMSQRIAHEVASQVA